MIPLAPCLYSTKLNLLVQSQFTSKAHMPHVLIVTDDQEADILVKTLAAASDGPFDTQCETSLDGAMERIAQGGVDIILATLDLPDSDGIATFDKLFAAARHIPIMTLAEHDGENLARQAVQRGAQGYLSKGHYGSSLVPQALRNIIERKAVEEALFKERAHAQVMLNSIGDAVISTDMAGVVTYLNPMAESLTGWLREDAYGSNITSVLNLIDSDTRKAPQPHPVLEVITEQASRSLSALAVLIRKDGYEIAVEDSIAPVIGWDGEVVGAVMVFRDVSQSRAMSARMKHLANHDYLTGLPNRVLLTDRLLHEISRATRNATRIAVLFLDLDHFKHINDSLGHEIGDALLKSVAKKLGTCVRRADTVGRLGGDEFVILLSDSVSTESITSVAEKVREALALPHPVSGHELYVTTSIGASIFPDDARDVGTLLKNADTAMYVAKEKGRNNFQFFDQAMNARAIERQLIESNLRHALARKEFVLHYQPKVDLLTGCVIGTEALLRWKHPKWGLVAPERFIAVAEECGLIVPIGRWVLQEACLQAKYWLDSGTGSGNMAVNISALEFRQSDFLQGVRKVLDETELPASRLQLEITESVVMTDAAASATTLGKLKELGVLLAVDDFGTGYSSLSYLKQFPIDVLKIDQSFVRDITDPRKDGAIVTAIIAMGKSLNLLVVAEGIENAVQLSFLKAGGCCQGQGLLFSGPLSADRLPFFTQTYAD